MIELIELIDLIVVIVVVVFVVGIGIVSFERHRFGIEMSRSPQKSKFK